MGADGRAILREEYGCQPLLAGNPRCGPDADDWMLQERFTVHLRAPVRCVDKLHTRTRLRARRSSHADAPSSASSTTGVSSTSQLASARRRDLTPTPSKFVSSKCCCRSLDSKHFDP